MKGCHGYEAAARSRVYKRSIWGGVTYHRQLPWLPYTLTWRCQLIGWDQTGCGCSHVGASHFLKPASPESLTHIFTQITNSSLCHNKKHSHKNITFEIIISTSVSDKILATQNVQSCIVLDWAGRKMLVSIKTPETSSDENLWRSLDPNGKRHRAATVRTTGNRFNILWTQCTGHNTTAQTCGPWAKTSLEGSSPVKNWPWRYGQERVKVV